jgi:hypothetical protein
MPSDRTPRDTEPAHGADAEGAGSVVVGPDPSNPEGVAAVCLTGDTAQLAERLREVGRGLQRMRESLVQAAPGLREFGRSWERARSTAFEFEAVTPRGDSMRWTPPADGEETPACPA